MKNNRQHITAFYLETLLLIAVFIAIILVLTRVFGYSRSHTAEAKMLTNAVALAQNAAEAAAAADTAEEAAGLLNENENVSLAEEGSGYVITAVYDSDMNPDPDGVIYVETSWEPEETEAGTLISDRIAVYYKGSETPVYSLETAAFHRK